MQVVTDSCPTADIECVLRTLSVSEEAVRDIEEFLRSKFETLRVVRHGVYVYNPILVVKHDSRRFALPILSLLPATGQLRIRMGEHIVSAAVDVCSVCSKLVGLEYGIMLQLSVERVKNIHTLDRLLGAALLKYMDAFQARVEALSGLLSVDGNIAVDVKTRERPGCTLDYIGLDAIQFFVQESVYSLLRRGYRSIGLSEIYKLVHDVSMLVSRVFDVKAYSDDRYEIKLITGDEEVRIAALFNIVARRFFAAAIRLSIGNASAPIEPSRLGAYLEEHGIRCKLRRVNCNELADKLKHTLGILREIRSENVFVPLIEVNVEIARQGQAASVRFRDSNSVRLKPVTSITDLLSDEIVSNAIDTLVEYCKRGLLPTHYQLDCSVRSS